MAILRVQHTGGVTGSSAAPSATLTNPPAQGNLMVAHIAWSEQAGAATPTLAGWTIVPTDGEVQLSGDVHHIVAYKFAGVSESSTVTGSLSVANEWFMWVGEYSGVASVSSIDVKSHNSNAAGTTTLDSGTTAAVAAANELWLGFLANKNFNAQTLVGTTFSQVAAAHTGTSAGAPHVSGGVYEKLDGAAGATANVQATITQARPWIGTIVVFKASTGGSSILGAAALTGLGSLTGIGKRHRYAGAVLAGAGSASLTGVVRRHGAAALSGLGSLLATPLNSIPGAAALSGLGSLSANAKRKRFGAATLSGAGSLWAIGSNCITFVLKVAGLAHGPICSTTTICGTTQLCGKGPHLTVAGTTTIAPTVASKDTITPDPVEC